MKFMLSHIKVKIRLFPALAIMPLFLLFCYQVPVSVNQPLDAPTGVTAIAVSESSINVSWNDIAQDVEGFIVERSATGSNTAFDWAAVNDADTNTYNDSNLSPQTNYFYRVMAYSGNIKSNYSAVVNATTQAIGTPAAPSGFTAAVLSSSSIRLTWTDNSNNETGFILEYSTGNSNWTQLTSSNVTTYDHTGCTAGTLYSYRVRAYNGTGQSNNVNVTAMTQQVVPAAPSNLTASVQSSSRIILAWTDNSSNEQGFILEYSVDNNNWTQLTSANVTTYDHTGLIASTTYYYRVRAYNIAGESANISISRTTPSEPGLIQIIADHNHINRNLLSDVSIAKASNLKIFYAHTSHGSQITSGVNGLKTFDTRFANSPIITEPWTDLGSSTWVTDTTTYLSNNPSTNVVMWSWCGQVSSASEASITDYLIKMTQLENAYPNIKFVYMTGHLDGSGLTGNLHIRNEQIRKYCRDNNKILFDFADIESYDPDGKFFGDKHPTDGCNYDYDGNGTTLQTGDPAEPVTPDRNWALDWQNNHPINIEWYDCFSAHSQSVNANMKAYAFWWLLVQIAE